MAKVHFKGWNAKFDEWKSITDGSLAPTLFVACPSSSLPLCASYLFSSPTMLSFFLSFCLAEDPRLWRSMTRSALMLRTSHQRASRNRTRLTTRIPAKLAPPAQADARRV